LSVNARIERLDGRRDPHAEADGPIGVAYLGADAGTAWSGTPAGLAAGLREAGEEAVLFNAELPRVLNGASRRLVAPAYGSRVAAGLSPPVSAVRKAVTRLRARPVSDLREWVLCGRAVSEAPRLGEREALFVDMTIVQARTLGHGGFATLPARIVDAVAERQARRYESAVAVCAASHWAARSLVHDYGVPPARVHVVGCGQNMPTSAAERDWSRPRFLFVGYDWERKNGPAIVRAFGRVRASLPAATLELVGRHPRIQADGVTDHGELSLSDPIARRRLAELFQGATCFVMPSRFEAFGIVYLEAGAAGVPSIGTTRGGAATPIGEGGVLVDPDDEDGLVRAMAELADPERARALGRAALENARRFTWEAVARRVLAALGRSDANAETLPAPRAEAR
jgi:glycosyltransferase involved in cell wall biosynthesis